MRIVFFGTPDFALPALERLDASHQLVAVVTQPDKPKGRHGQPQPSPARLWAQARGIPVLTPARLKENEEFVEALAKLNPEVCVVAAYGKMLPQQVLDVPRGGFINIHGSILPRYRGSAPIQRALMAGEARTGATIMNVVLEMDAGDILRVTETDIRPDDDYGTLAERLSHLGADALIEALADIEAGKVRPRKQDEKLVLYAPPITKDEAQIDWNTPAERIFNQIRGLSPKPGAYAYFDGRRLKILKNAQTSGEAALDSGKLAVEDGRLLIGTSSVPLEILVVQPEGKRPMKAAEFVRGYRIETGTHLDTAS